ncbi:MAG: hypothetical protein WCZ11_01140, partial [Bacilli bacterium]
MIKTLSNNNLESFTIEEFYDISTGLNGYIDGEHSQAEFKKDQDRIIGNYWSTTSSLNQARYQLAGCGDVNNALSFGGYTGADVATTEKWNGSTWSTTSSLNQARYYLAGCGDVNNALSFGG